MKAETQGEGGVPTLQEIFDKCVGGLIQQGVPAIGAYGCMYRTEDGLKCAVGQLVPDWVDGVDESDEPEAVYCLVYHHEPTDEVTDLLECLQSAHDDGARRAGKSGFIGAFLRSAKNLSDVFGLEWRFESVN